VIGLPTLVGLFKAVSLLLGQPSQATRRRVKRTLQSSLVAIARNGYYPGDVTQLSYHVWVVAPISRRLLPSAFRKLTARDSHGPPRLLRPALHRLAMYRFEHLDASGIKFREGIGLIGRCIAKNEVQRARVLALDRGDFRSLLSQGRDAWDAASVDLTQHLSYDDAQRLAESYGQVAALAIRNENGHAIGCITLDLPPNVQIDLTDPAQSRDLLRELATTRDHIANLLTASDRS
jgi:hypothetical protein